MYSDIKPHHRNHICIESGFQCEGIWQTNNWRINAFKNLEPVVRYMSLCMKHMWHNLEIPQIIYVRPSSCNCKFININKLSAIKNILETPKVQCHEISGDSLRNFARIQNNLQKSNHSQLSVNHHLPPKFTIILIQADSPEQFLLLHWKK